MVIETMSTADVVAYALDVYDSLISEGTVKLSSTANQKQRVAFLAVGERQGCTIERWASTGLIMSKPTVLAGEAVES